MNVEKYEMYKYHSWSLKTFGEHFIECLHLEREKDKR